MTIPTTIGLSFDQQIARRTWPDIPNGGDLHDIVQIARDCMDATDVPRAIASVLIYQQLTEEFLSTVDYWCYYEKALALYPVRLRYHDPGRIMFGGLVKRIEQHQDFHGKDAFLKECRAIAECRNPIAHRLVERTTLSSVAETARAVSLHFDAALIHFGNAHLYFYDRFASLAEKSGIADARA